MYICYIYINLIVINIYINDNYIIIIGELGASDGTEGIYHYLMNNKEIITS